MSFVKRSLTNLPLDELIGAPLTACAKAQQQLAQTTINFIREVGFNDGSGNAVEADGTAVSLTTVSFSYKTKEDDNDGTVATEKTITVPLLSIVNVPSLSIQTCDISFKMNVSQSRQVNTSATLAVKYKKWFSPVTASFKGSLSTTSNKSATAEYTVNVSAADNGAPSGLTKVLGMLEAAILEE